MAPNLNTTLPDIPSPITLEWCTANLAVLEAYLLRARLLSNLSVVVTFNGKTVPCPVRFSAGNSTIEVNLS